MKPKYMKYLLICIGDYSKNQKEIIQKVANEIMPTVSSPTVKYYNNDCNLIYHFESVIPFYDLKLLIDDAVTPFVGTYLLIQCTPTMSLGMPQQLYDYLFDLSDDNRTPPDISNINVIQQDVETDEEFLNSLNELRESILSEDDCDDELARIMNKTKNKDEVPTLDNILDKISTEGMGSLTKKEKELLEKYSK